MQASSWGASVRMTQDAKVQRTDHGAETYVAQRRAVYDKHTPHPMRDGVGKFAGLHPLLGHYRSAAKVRTARGRGGRARGASGRYICGDARQVRRRRAGRGNRQCGALRRLAALAALRRRGAQCCALAQAQIVLRRCGPARVPTAAARR